MQSRLICWSCTRSPHPQLHQATRSAADVLQLITGLGSRMGQRSTPRGPAWEHRLPGLVWGCHCQHPKLPHAGAFACVLALLYVPWSQWELLEMAVHTGHCCEGPQATRRQGLRAMGPSQE